MNKKNADRFFDNFNPNTAERYSDYWQDLVPQNEDDFLRRYLFAFASVHTTWKGNIRGYKAVRDLKWLKDKNLLHKRLTDSRCGMQNVRTEIMWKFATQFYANPDLYCRVIGDWVDYRNTIVNLIKGLGVAKVSFTIEMCFPLQAELSCIDTHGIQLYELDTLDFKSKKGLKLYQDVEEHWVSRSKEVGFSSYITRCVFWDKKQNRRNTRYWSHVLEQ